MIRRHAGLFVLALLLLSVVSCEPRGETKSLDDVLRIAKADYLRLNASAASSIDATIANNVKAVAGDLDLLLSATSMQVVQGKSKEVADRLASVALNAGFTARPALGELINQYRVLSGMNSQEVTVAGIVGNSSGIAPQWNVTVEADRAKVKLLVARTYSLLAAELETTKFGVMPGKA